MPGKKTPHGWLQVSLGEICLPVTTVQPGDEPDASFTYFDIGGIDNRRNLIAETKTVLGKNAPSRARQAVQRGDILFSTVRTYLRNIARIKDEPTNPVASTGFTVIRPAPGVAGEFVFQQILSEHFLQPLHALQTGSSYPAVRDRDVFAQPVMLPPSGEQQRIVEKLDAILLHISSGEAAAQRALAGLKRYRAAVLNAAVIGELTREWRKTQPKPDETGGAFLRRLLATRRARWEETELARLTKSGKPLKDDKWKARYSEPTKSETTEMPSLPRGWVWASVEQLSSHRPRSMTDGPFGSHLKSSHYTESGPRVIRLQNIGDGVFIDEKAHISEKHYDFLIDHAVFAGDIVIRAMGIPAPRACMIPPDIGPAIVKADCIRLEVEPEFANAKFALIALNAPSTQHRTESLIHGIGRPRLNLGEIKAIAVPLPPIAEQEEIVRQVDHRLTLADGFAASLETALARARAWRQSILNTAFTGHLVQQNDDDEPASVLLGKIRAARELLAAQPKPRRGSRKKTMKEERRNLLEVLKETKVPMKPEDLFATAGFDESTVEAFFSELKELVAQKKVREKRDAQERGFVRLEVRV